MHLAMSHSSPDKRPIAYSFTVNEDTQTSWQAPTGKESLPLLPEDKCLLVSQRAFWVTVAVASHPLHGSPNGPLEICPRHT